MAESGSRHLVNLEACPYVLLLTVPLTFLVVVHAAAVCFFPFLSVVPDLTPPRLCLMVLTSSLPILGPVFPSSDGHASPGLSSCFL